LKIEKGRFLHESLEQDLPFSSKRVVFVQVLRSCVLPHALEVQLLTKLRSKGCAYKSIAHMLVDGMLKEFGVCPRNLVCLQVLPLLSFSPFNPFIFLAGIETKRVHWGLR
jgi:hypothetical protein